MLSFRSVPHALPRFLPPTLISGGITFLLFWSMTALIAVPDVVTVAPPVQIIQWVKVQEDRPEPPPEPRTPKRPPVEQQPTLPTTIVDPTVTAIPPARITPGNEGMRKFTAPLAPGGDGDAVPIVRVAPRYPERAAMRGIEGRVLIEFTVDRVGSVKSAAVVAAEPPNIFDKAALEAVRQWRYTPRIVNGVAVEREGLKISIPFRLGDR